VRVATIVIALVTVVALLELGGDAVATRVPDADVQHAMKLSTRLTAGLAVFGAVAFRNPVSAIVVVTHD
jgi:hypothetical protein